MKRELDIAVISDVHLGTYSCHAKELLDYLRSINPKTLIINGDFIDMWEFRKQYFPKEHMQVVHKVLRMAAKGTKVYYITGNRDYALRPYIDFSSGNIHLRDKLILQLKGKRLAFFHGDVFDLSVRYSSWVRKLGSKSYSYLVGLNRWVNKIRVRFGAEPMSLARTIKERVKKAVVFTNEFEESALRTAAENNYDIVVCGHIHRHRMRSEEIEGKNVTYLNSGDWVENLTALEYNWGSWTIYQYDEADYACLNDKLIVREIQQMLEEELEEEKEFNQKGDIEYIIRQVVDDMPRSIANN